MTICVVAYPQVRQSVYDKRIRKVGYTVSYTRASFDRQPAILRASLYRGTARDVDIGHEVKQSCGFDPTMSVHVKVFNCLRSFWQKLYIVLDCSTGIMFLSVSLSQLLDFEISGLHTLESVKLIDSYVHAGTSGKL